MAEGRASSETPPTAPLQVAPPGKPRSGALTGVVVAVAVICALYFGRAVLIPITLAVLLSFVLAPLMELLRRFWLPRVVAALVAVLIAIGVMIILGGFIGTQIAGLAEQVPQYQTTIETKVGSLRKLIATDLSNRISGWTHKIEGTVLPKQGTLTPQRRGPGTLGQPGGGRTGSRGHHSNGRFVGIGDQPTYPAAGHRPDCRSGDYPRGCDLHSFAESGPSGPADPPIRIGRSSPYHRSDERCGSAADPVFLTQLGINFSFGVIVGVGLYLLGVPSPVLWGILGALLRFVPYIGSYIAAALPILLAAAPCSSARRRPAAS